MIDLQPYISAVDWVSSVEVRGRVTELIGLLIRAAVPGARVGELCLIHSPHRAKVLRAEVVGFRGSEVILMPLGDVSDVAMGAEVVPTGTSLTIRVGEDLLGRVLDGLGEPLDGKGAIEDGVERTVAARPPDPMKRQRVTKQLKTGIRALDGLLTVGEGQRIGIFAAAGVGKSTTLGMLARNTEADVNVIALIGERGREVRDFLEQDLGEEGLKKSVVVVATSNEPSLIRMKAAYVATAIADMKHLESAGKLREVLATYEAQRDLILIGAYKKGSDPKTDYAVSKIEAVNKFLRQGTHEQMPSEAAIQRLIQLF